MIDVFYTKPSFQDNLTLLLKPFFDFYKFVYTFSLFYKKQILKHYRIRDSITFLSDNIQHTYSICPSEGLTSLKLEVPFENFILFLNFSLIRDDQNYYTVSLRYRKSRFKFIDMNCLFNSQNYRSFPISASLICSVHEYHCYYPPDRIWFQMTTHDNDLILVKKNSDVSSYGLLSKKTINKYEKAWNDLLRFDMILLFKKIFKNICIKI